MSDRDRWGGWRGRAAVVAMVVFSLGLATNPGRVSELRDLASRGLAVFGPAPAPASRLQQLEAELAATRAALVRAVDELARTREQAREALALEPWVADARLERLIPARVLARAEGKRGHSRLLLDRGSADGVRLGMAVTKGPALVGKVCELSATSCRVALLDDPACRVRALLLMPPLVADGPLRRLPGACWGASDGIQLRFVPTESAPQPGAQVVTAGLAGRVPPGLLIGSVREIDSPAEAYEARILIEPSASLEGLTAVSILSPPEAGAAEETR